MRKKRRSLLETAAAVWSAGRQAASISRSGGEVRVLEAEDLAALQNETEGFTRLSGNWRELPGWNHQKMQNIAFYLYRNNHLAHRIIELIEDFVLGDGVLITATSEAVKDAINDFWFDPINQMDRLNPKRFRDLCLLGEVLLPATVSRDGAVRLGWIDQTAIDDVIPDKAGRPRVIKINSNAAEAVGKKELEVIHFDDETKTYVGDAFYETINNSYGSMRGISDIFTAADWIDSLEETLFSGADRTKYINNHVLDVTLEGADEAFVQAWLKANGEPPEPNSMTAHNEKVKYQYLSPQLGAYEISRMSKDLREYILAGIGIPPHWAGPGDDANLATAQQMSEPTRKKLKKRQKGFIWLLTDILTYAIQKRREANTLKVTDEEAEDFEVSIPDFSGPDIGSVGASVSQLVAAVDAAVEGEYISRKRGRGLVAVVFSELGVEISQDEEEEQIAEEKGERDEKQQKKDEEAQQRIQDNLAKAKAALQQDNGGKPSVTEDQDVAET